MTFEEIHQKLQAKFQTGVLGVESTKPDPFIKVEPKMIREILVFMRDEMQFETLGDLCGVDLPAQNNLAVVYHPTSYTHKTIVCLKAFLPREGAKIPSVVPVFKGANWMERETYDLLGIEFEGHPDHRRILCPEDWTGHPLRKDYKTPDYYNGMPVPLSFDDPQADNAGGHA